MAHDWDSLTRGTPVSLSLIVAALGLWLWAAEAGQAGETKAGGGAKAGSRGKLVLDRAGKEFFRTPRPRWESLHALQGLVELYRVTGDATFRTAFLHHWASMRRFDYRNTGGFSSGERATGNPYKNDAIETCCVVAYQEVMIDALRLTGRSTIADDLEQTTLNAMLGAQHPSGAWCTYNTPMAGRRIPSHIHIRFQARPDAPHLNCCSVNGPRGYGKTAGAYKPWLVVDAPAADGGTVRLIDFASAGATTVEGKPLSSYTTWLAAQGMAPPPPVAWLPADRAKVGPGPIRFVWRRPADAAKERTHTVVIADDPACRDVVARSAATPGGWLLLREELARKLRPHAQYYWKVIARNRYGQTESIPPYKQFVIDPKAPPIAGGWPYGQRETDQMVTEALLRGEVKPSYGTLLAAKGWKPAPGPGGKPRGAIELDGKAGMVKYRILAFPEEDYTVAVRVCVTRMPATKYGQVFSARAAGMDDPIRLVVEGGKLYARVEARRFYGTRGFPLRTGTWYHVAGVKKGRTITLYVNGKARATADVPATVSSRATEFALGGNPRYHGPEFLPARLAELKFYARALSADEVKQLHGSPIPKP